MKPKQTCQVVMLPTTKASQLYLSNNVTKQLEYLNKAQIMRFIDNQPANQHLYILSNKPININDWAYHKLDGIIIQITPENIDRDIRRFGYKKVEASTDKEITPDFLIANEFMSVYLDSYNKNNPISEVDLEMIKLGGTVFTPDEPFVIKTRIDNTVIIHPIKKYSQSEVDDLLDRQTCITTDRVLKRHDVYRDTDMIAFSDFVDTYYCNLQNPVIAASKLLEMYNEKIGKKPHF